VIAPQPWRLEELLGASTTRCSPNSTITSITGATSQPLVLAPIRLLAIDSDLHLNQTVKIRATVAAACVVAITLSNQPARAVSSQIPVPKLVAGVGSVNASWSRVGNASSYTLLDGRGKVACTTKSTSCIVRLTDPLAIRFRLQVSSNGSSATGSWSRLITPRLVFLLAGQSNATGVESFAIEPGTKVDYFKKPYASPADLASKINWFPWTMQPEPGSTWQPLKTPQYEKSDTFRQWPIFGPEVGFARQMWKIAQRPVYIIKSTYPGASLSDHWAPSANLYQLTVSSTMSRLQTDAKRGDVDVLGGVIFYQGEADMAEPVNAPQFGSNLNSFLDALTRDLPFMGTPAVVFAVPSLSAYITRQELAGNCGVCEQLRVGEAEVRAAFFNLTREDLRFALVDTDKLPRRSPGAIHLHAASELQLGAEIATSMATLLGLQP